MTFWYVLWAAILLYIASSGAAAALRIQGGTPLSCCKHGVVRRRPPLDVVVVIVLAHHVHFAQVQKERVHKADTRSLVFARNRSPATRGSPVDRRATLGRRGSPRLVYCPDQAPSSPHGGTTPVKGFGGQVRSLLQDGRRRHRCLCRLGRRVLGSVVALCCPPQGRVSQRSNGGGPGGGRTWGACCPVDAVGGPYASRRCQQRSPLYALGLSGPALLRPVPADPVLALWA